MRELKKLEGYQTAERGVDRTDESLDKSRHRSYKECLGSLEKQPRNILGQKGSFPRGEGGPFTA